jgi:phosphate transport system substrate-binding protein
MKEKIRIQMKKYKLPTLAISAILLLAVGLMSCASATTTPPPQTSPLPTQSATRSATTSPTSTLAPVNLNGAGATFPQPLYTKWFSEYAKITGAQVNYQGVGSGAGINQVTAGTVDFGASDGIMTDAQQKAAEAAGGPILHIPMTSGAVALIYNVPGIASGTIKLNGDVLANIFLKTINNWNDPRIGGLNPGVNLPNIPIVVVHRSDSSGTTYIFTNYLNKVSTDWSTQVGNATSVKWPGDIGGQGNAGVAGSVQQTQGAIGYVELAYAEQNKLPWMLLKNAAGNYEAPSLAGTTAATVGITLPDDMKVIITNSTNADAYPICGFSWMLVYVNQTNQAKGQTLANMLWWGIHDGQSFAPALGYAPFSAAVVTKAENEIKSINYKGTPFIK